MHERTEHDVAARAGTPAGGMPAAPLDGIMVVALEQAVAVPFATRQLADLGARVIKIERPGDGDFARHYDRSVLGQSSYFVWLNRGKESVELDVKSLAGQEALAALLARADVFVQNLAPGAAGRLGLDADRLAARHPRLICCSVSGYGQGGPYQHKKAYDLLVQCETGLLAVTGTPDEPAKAGISVADIAAGMYACSGVLTALYERERTGRGSSFEVSLIDALGEWMSQPYLYTAYGGEPLRRTGARHATISPYGPYAAADGEVFIGLQNDREWAVLCERVLARPGLAGDPRFATNPDRVAHDEELTAIIEGVIGSRPADEVIALLDRAGIANARLRTPAGFGAHPQLAARDRWRQVSTPAGQVRVLLPPVTVPGREPAMRPVPALGQHTAAVLAELAVSHGETDSAADRRFGTDVLAGAAARIIDAWVRAVGGDETELAALARPGATRWLLQPVRKRWRVAPGPRVTAVQGWVLEPEASPPRARVRFDFDGRRLLLDEGRPEDSPISFVGMLNLTLDEAGRLPWLLDSGHVETLDQFLGYTFASRRETHAERAERAGGQRRDDAADNGDAAGPRRLFKITARFAEHDERFSSVATVTVRRPAAPAREEAVRLVWPAVQSETARALGDGDWRPSLSSVEVVELLA